jgi:heat-inducible transcriptional repressor
MSVETRRSRSDDVLSAVVRHFIRRARPVSSAHVAGDVGRGLSSATIRNEMARLEEAGLLIKPHTSAGRIPTEKGYRHFVLNLGQNATLPAEQRQHVLKVLGSAAKDGDILQQGTRLLTELSRLIGLALTPGAGPGRLAHLEFISLGERRVMILLVLEGEQIRRKVLRLRHSLRREELRRLSVFIMGQLGGMALPAAKLRIEEILTKGIDLPLRLVTARYLCDGLEDMLDELSGELATGEQLLYSHGWSDVDGPEFRDAALMRRILRVVNDQAAVGSLVRPRIGGQGVNVLIGNENDLPEMRDCSVISASCASEDGEHGSLAVIGPLRMDYERVIPLVDFTSQVIAGRTPKTGR